MLSKRKLLLSFFLFSFPVFSSKQIAVAAVPAESSHSNTNTGTNLNTLTNTGNITFTVNYNAVGDIKWYKDNVLAETDTNSANGSFTTSWAAADYGKVKQVKVNSTNGDGTSADTVWNVEVQRTGTATLSEDTSDASIDNMVVGSNGWSNFPSLYLHFKNDSLLGYVSAGTYNLRGGVYINGGTFFISSDTVKVLRMRAIPPVGSDTLSRIVVAGGGTLKVDKVNIYGWNFTAGREVTDSDQTYSPYLESRGNNEMDVTNSNFRSIMLSYKIDSSANDVVDNNSFYMSAPAAINLLDGGGSDEVSSDGQTISNNYIYVNDQKTIYGCNQTRDVQAPNTVFLNNKFFTQEGGGAGDTTEIGQKSAVIGNEYVYSSYNLTGFPIGMFARNNNLHDNGGSHNAYNMIASKTLSVNDYCHDITAFACFYYQGSASSLEGAEDSMLINSFVANSCVGLDVRALNHGYFYNHSTYDTNSKALNGADNIFWRKSTYCNSDIEVSDNCMDEGWNYVGNIYVIDTLFYGYNPSNNTHWWHYQMSADATGAAGSHAKLWGVNTVYRNDDNSIAWPTVFWEGNKGEVRNYVYLDTVVLDSSGNKISGATVTVTPLTDASYPAVNLLLPPPPPDITTNHHEVMPPMPSTATFSSATTGVDGHTPLPNYGWSANTEATPIILAAKEKAGSETTSYSYRITATYNSQSVSKDVTPGISWYREDPIQPAETVVLTINKPAGKYALNVNGGTGSGLYNASQSVNISAGAAPSGKVFEKWIGDTTGIANVNSANTTITVPSADASITAYFKDITYHLTVTGGTGSGDYPAGKFVIVDAAPASGAQKFYKWTGTGATSVISPTVYSSLLEMPAQNIAVTATYRNPISYNCRLTVADGEGTDFYPQGANVTVSAPESPSADRIFDHWDGDTANLANASAYSTTLTNMPASYLIIYPVYRDSGLPSNDANLSNLAVSGGTLSPNFSSGTTGYTVNVGAGVASVTVTPTASQGASAAIRVNGTSVNSGAASGPINLNVGANAITVIVTAPDTATTKTYTITVTRAAPPSNDATLSNLTISSGTLTPGFLSGTTAYTGVVANNVTSIRVTPTASRGASAAIRVNGASVNSGSASGPVNLNIGANAVTIIVTAPDTTTTKTYTITVTRTVPPSNDATLSNLAISPGILTSGFLSGTTAYTGVVANNVTSIRVTPTASRGANAAIRVNGTSVDSGSASGSISLNVGASIITVVVTAPDTTTTQTYTITVIREAISTTATAYTLTAPSPASGVVNAASGNFTVTSNGTYTGTITVTPSGGGLSTPVTLTFSNSSAAQTFSITPAAAGVVTLTSVNNGGLTDPAAVTYTAYVPGTLRNSSWNYPNPVNFSKTDKTTIAYTVEEECNVYICLYTLAGNLAKVLVNNRTETPGKYYIDWYGDTDGGGKAASGAYLYVAKIGNDTIKKKIILVR